MTPTSLLLAAAAVTLAPVAAELAARWWVRRRDRYYVFPPGLRLLLHPDPAVFPKLEPTVRFEVNRAGERGGEVPGLRSGETLYRVLVAGGSQPEGYMLDQHTSWPGALHRLLQEPEGLRRLGATKVHVGSIARSGVGAEALHLILGRVLPRYPRLQAIILLVGASDVLRWLEQGAPPSPPTPPDTSELFRCHPQTRFGWRPGAAALVELVRGLRRRWLRPVDVHERAGGWVGRARAMRARASVVRTALPEAEPMLRHFERHFEQALRLARAHAERVIVVRQPWFDRPCTGEEAALMWHGGVGRAWQEEVTVFYSHDVLSRLMGLLDARAAGLARRLGVEQLDLRPILEPGPATYYDFFHATPAGARAVAAAVAAVVLGEPVAAPADATEEEVLATCAGWPAS